MVVLRRHLRGLGPRSGSALASALRARGLAVEEVGPGAEAPPPADSVVWLVGSPRWHRTPLRELAALPPPRRPTVVLWLTEPLPFARGSGVRQPGLGARELAKIVLRDSRATDPWTNARLVRRLARDGAVDLLVVTSEAKREYLAQHSVTAATVPFGYHEPSHGRLLGLERDLDVLFLGLTTRRRSRALRALRRAGVRVEALGSWTDPALWREGRTRLLNRTKVLLNLSRHQGQFAGLRFVLGMANGAAVVSEPVHRPEPFRPGEHYVEGRLAELPAEIERLLAHEAGRERIAARGHAFVTGELTLHRSVGRVLDLLAAEVA